MLHKHKHNVEIEPSTFHSKFSEAGISVNLKKCSFLSTQIKYLGRNIRQGQQGMLHLGRDQRQGVCLDVSCQSLITQ